jgi:hypothetical protein
MNITEESSALLNLMKNAEKQDKENPDIKPQECSLDDSECVSCGS